MLFSIFFVIYSNSVLSSSVTDAILDSVPQIEKGYSRRPPFSLYGGFGLLKPQGDLLKVEPVFEELATEAGFSFQAGLVIPIPVTKFLALQGTLLSQTTSSVKNEKDNDQFYFDSYDYNVWAQYDPNNIYGIRDFMENSFWFSEGTSWDGYSSQTQLLGLGLYLPISRGWRNFIFCSYQTGKMELSFGETRKYLSTDFIFNNGQDIYVISSPSIEMSTKAQFLDGGLFFTAGRRLNIAFHVSRLTASTANFTIPISLTGYGDVLETFSRNSSVRYSGTCLHFTMGFRL